MFVADGVLGRAFASGLGTWTTRHTMRPALSLCHGHRTTLGYAGPAGSTATVDAGIRMTTTYRAVMLTKKGGPEVLQVVDLPIEPPGPAQLRVRVCAAGVGSTDLLILAGNYRYAPKIPFVPGYQIAGVV